MRLKAAFIDHFVASHTTGMRLPNETKLHNCKLGSKETIHDLYHDIVIQGAKLRKSKADLVLHFLQALPLEYQKVVITNSPQSLQKAIEMAKAAEAQDELARSHPELVCDSYAIPDI